MLNAMRFGKLDPGMIMQFHQLSRAVKYDDGIEPADLYVYLNLLRYETAANFFSLHNVKVSYTKRGRSVQSQKVERDQ